MKYRPYAKTGTAVLVTFFAFSSLLFAAPQEGPKSAEINPNVVEGLDLRVTGPMELTVTPGVCRIDGKEVKVNHTTVLHLAQPGDIRIEGEEYVLKTEEPKRWYGGTKLRGCMSNVIPLPNCYVPHSVSVRPLGDAAAKPFEEGKDFLVDHGWGMVGRVAEGRLGAEEKVAVDYAYSLRRVDTVQVSPSGTVSLRRGTAAKTCPHPAGAEAGCLALANLFFDYRAEKITDNEIFVIGRPFPKESPEACQAKAALVPGARKRLAEGGTLKIGFWGDSVTCGADVDKKDSYVESFIRELKQTYPKATIDYFNAGIDGSSTGGRLPNLQKDVLDQKPDLVIIEFVNDMGYSPEVMQKHYGEAIDKIRAIGAEVILVTPHFTMPAWMKFEGSRGKENRAACLELKKIAQQKQTGLADASRRWEYLEVEGLPYVTLLFNGINHPDARGHQLFVEELMTHFQK